MNIKFLLLPAALGMAVFGQVSSNQSLSGKYYFRQVLLVTDGTASANVTDTRSGTGILTFDGAGTFTISGQQLVGTSASAALSGNGTYAVKPGGFVTLSNPLRSAVTVNARLGVGAVVGSSTEAGGTVFDLFIAIPAAAQPVSNSTLNGAYWISSLEFPNGGLSNIRDTNFKLTANGTGSFAESSVTGQAANLGNKLRSQPVGPMTYSISADGSGTLAFPIAAGLDATTQLIGGVKNVYVSQDGNYLIGGSTVAGVHGLVVGVKAFNNNATSTSWNGFYYTAGMRYDTPFAGQPARLWGVVGAVNALDSATSVWARRTRQSDGLLDASLLITYSLGADGSGAFTSTSGRVMVASNAQIMATTGVAAIDSPSSEIYFVVRLPVESGAGVFLYPQGVLNTASFAPPGSPISPGSFVTLFGTGFGTQTAAATNFPILPLLAGVQVTVNGTFAPIYSLGVSPVPYINAIVPYGVTGSTATIVVIVNGTKSNSVDVPLAATAPAVFTVPSRGVGDAAIRHTDALASVVNASNPAAREEVVAIYLTGLGVVSPPLNDGVAAPIVEPLARIVGPVNVYIGGQLVTDLQFKGLVPTLAGEYQLNVRIPLTVPSRMQDVAIQTVEGFTDMANIAIK
jgi:uncharacterized protein (TIGR03437 family)